MAEQLTDPVTHHGEGAVWSDLWGGLKWVDMLAGAVLSLHPDTGEVSRMPVGSPVAAAVRPRLNGGMLVVTEREFTLWQGDVQEFATPPLWTDSARRFNEGGCDPEGRMLCGSLAYAGDTGGGEMFRLNTDGSTERLWGDVTTSNGLGFTASGERMYYIDSETRRIDVFDVDVHAEADAGSALTGRRPFASIEEGRGFPDGLWVDELDGVWVALYGGSAVHHYDSRGILADIVELPVSKVTSCCLGGPDRSTLFITTSRENLAVGDEPAAGSLFTAQAGVRGVEARPFAG
ncbi:sugar lactone lactonase YvrE [Subtercola boreus]|nr:sugar lactone lactonase YvrE [Subtercola boreus]